MKNCMFEASDSQNLWIQTRDGSPTLWSNELGESYRSVKGAFTESALVFVEPGLNFLKKKSQTEFSKKFQIGEFGLGLGTNWMMWVLRSQGENFDWEYFAVDRNPRIFERGLKKWMESVEFLSKFLERLGTKMSPEMVQECLERAPRPRIYHSLEEARDSGERADLWFHDPFGFDVNPEGYSLDLLKSCQKLWKDQTLAMTYACNSRFQKTLREIPGIFFKKILSPHPRLKREALLFGQGEIVF